MRPKFLLLGSLVCALLGWGAVTAPAQTLAFAISSETATNGGRFDFRGSLGLYFSLSQSLTISSVGYWDDNRDGIDGTLTVAIFSRPASGTPTILASQPFSGLDGALTGGIVNDEFDAPPENPHQAGQFRLANLSSPVTLPAGDYALVAWGYTFANQSLNGSNDGPVFDVESFGGTLSFAGSAYNEVAGAFPDQLDPENGSIERLYVAATFSPDTVSAIPEPASVALGLGAAATAMIAWRKRRHLAPTAVSAVD